MVDHKLIHGALTYKIIGCALEVHNELGPGFLESAYEAAMLVELRSNGLAVKSQQKFPLLYKGKMGQKNTKLAVKIDSKVTKNDQLSFS